MLLNVCHIEITEGSWCMVSHDDNLCIQIRNLMGCFWYWDINDSFERILSELLLVA